jgi:hypothetical protein
MSITVLVALVVAGATSRYIIQAVKRRRGMTYSYRTAFWESVGIAIIYAVIYLSFR